MAEETNTSNNCSAAVAVKVTEPPRRPDLVVTAASASEAELSPGEAFELTATVGNRGGDASATTLRYHRSADASITTSDTQVGTDAVAALAAGATSAESLTLNAPTAPGTHYYGACADAVAEETNTSNNCSAAVAVKVTEPPRRPDLVVTAASASEAELSPGEAFELTATVGNRGGDASATTLRYHRSADASITAGDAEVGTDAVAALAAGATSAGSLTLNAPTAPGTYYYGACADAVAGESITTNNCSTGVAVKVTEPPRRPDLAVAATPSDEALEPGESFTLSATVRNRGGAQAQATTLRYHRSTDATITTSDTQVGTDAVAALAAGATSAESLTLNAPTAPGTYYYGACADAVAEETSTSNNCSAAVAVKVTEPPPRPDLVVTAASASEAELSPGAAFDLRATVGNRGGTGASATTLRYYRSADAAITTSDTQVGTDAVAALAAGATSAESLTLNAPTAPGTHYYGACADAVAEETNTSNNCSAAVAVKVTEPPRQPDLVVTAMLSDAELDPGESFTLSATVRNRGGAQAQATTLRYYRSTDATIARSDEAVGTDSVAALGALAASAESVELTAPSTAGTFYYGACADAVAEETNTGNNCSAAVAVTVREPPRQPDLVVTAMLSDAELDPGESFTLSATVRNRGGAQAQATTLRYYRSTDATIARSDEAVGTDSVAALGALAASAESVELTAPSTAGTFYYGACVDAVADETETANNCSVAVAVTVSEPARRGPDVTMSAWSMVEGSVLSPGTMVRLVGEARNVGHADTDPLVYVHWFHSDDGTITWSDDYLSANVLRRLEPGGVALRTKFVQLPQQEDTYYYGLCAAPQLDETDTSNNCSAAVELEVGAGGLLPDLAVTATAEEYTLYPTVTNVGSLRAEPARLIYYCSPDAVKSPDDVPISPKHTLLPSLAPEEKASYREYFSASQRWVGHPYFYACAGPVAGEKNTDNNCSAVYSMVPIVERELEVSVPRDCPLEVEVCVLDHACVDGDIVRVSVNGTVIYTHEIVAAWHCETASVNVGANKIEAYAVNEWGRKGGCRANTVNTGALEVRTGLGASGTAWSSRKGGISTIRLNVAVGDAGPCTEEGE